MFEKKAWKNIIFVKNLIIFFGQIMEKIADFFTKWNLSRLKGGKAITLTK